MATKAEAQNGSELTLQGVDFAHSMLSLILVSSPSCPYCLASKHFHSKILELARTNHVPFYVLVPSRSAASEYLADLAVSNDSVKEYAQMNDTVSGTPTILGVDNTGHVRGVWSGLATPADESAIADTINTRSFSISKQSTGINAPNLQLQELVGLKRTTSVEVLAVAEMEEAHVGSASLDIPLQELPYRAQHELDKNRLQVIDCTNLLWDQCENAVTILNRLRFNTMTLGAGTYHRRCELTPLS